MTSTRKEQNWIHEQIDFLLENLGSVEPGDFLCDFSLLLYGLNEGDVDSTLLLSANKQEWQAEMAKLCSKNHWLCGQSSTFGRALAIMGEKRVSYLSGFLKISSQIKQIYMRILQKYFVICCRPCFHSNI